MSTGRFSLMRSFRAAVRDVVEMLREGDVFSRYFVYGVTGLFAVLFGIMGALTPAATIGGKVLLIVGGFVLTPMAIFTIGTFGYCLLEAFTDWDIHHNPRIRATKKRLRHKLRSYRNLRRQGLTWSEVSPWEAALGSPAQVGFVGPRSVRRLLRRCDRMHAELQTMFDSYWCSERSFRAALEDAYARTGSSRIFSRETDCVWVLQRPIDDAAVRRLVDAYTPPQASGYPLLLCTPSAIHDLVDRVATLMPVASRKPGPRFLWETREKTVSHAVLLRGAEPDIVWTLLHDGVSRSAPAIQLGEVVETARLL